jgi:hypothetical protein
MIGAAGGILHAGASLSFAQGRPDLALCHVREGDSFLGKKPMRARLQDTSAPNVVHNLELKNDRIRDSSSRPQ